MKISKLFHWLYAILMLLPAFAIGVTCSYAIFNKNAYQSYSNEQVEYSYRVENLTQYSNGLKYQINNTQTPPTQNGNYRQLDYISLTATDLNISQIEYNSITKWILLNNGQIIFCDDNNTWVTRINFGNENATITQFDFIGEIGQEFFAYIITYTQYKTIGLDSVFYYSLDKVKESPLFNWAYDSFLATPITYITGLFGMASDHIAVMLMSYWLAISVIWLVLDMVMYVPLLVHRWIDKGVLE